LKVVSPNRMRVLLLLACCASLLSIAIRADAAAADNANRAASELKKTLEQLNALDRWFSETERKRTNWEKLIKRQDEDIAGLHTALRATSSRLTNTEEELDELAAEQTALTTQRKQQAQLIGEHLAAAHRLTGQDFFKQLLNQESPDTFERMVRYHHYFSQARIGVIDQFQDTLKQLAATNATLEERRGEQSHQYSLLEKEQNNLAEQRDGRSQLIAQLDLETKTKNEEHKRLQQSRQRLEELLVELRRRAIELDGSAFVTAKGSLPMPVAGPVRHGFGQTRANGRLTWHGLDLAAPHGTPITAIFRGRVLFSDWLRGFGLLTILDHGSGYMTLYGNVDVLHKKVGDWVESGEIIAGAGNSSGKKAPGLYFEVRHEGTPQDPIVWISR